VWRGWLHLLPPLAVPTSCSVPRWTGVVYAKPQWEGLWDKFYHGFARTTAAVCRAKQHSQKSLNESAEHYGINPKTVAKWKKRGFANDPRLGPKDVRSTVRTTEEEAAVVAFRKYTLLVVTCT
jgi:hypothetical protein